MNVWNKIATDDELRITKIALEQNGFDVEVVDTAQQAKQAALDLIPHGSEVMTMASATLQAVGITDEIQNSKEYRSVKQQLSQMDRATQHREMQIIGSAPEYALGSVHAITHQGELLIASNTGSQLPAYVYGADHVIWVVGAQKVVSTLQDAFTRLEEYTLPLESKRVQKAYGMKESVIRKILIVKSELILHRVHIILVKENLGF